jgi:hypothetical protein
MQGARLHLSRAGPWGYPDIGWKNSIVRAAVRSEYDHSEILLKIDEDVDVRMAIILGRSCRGGNLAGYFRAF